MSEVIAGTQGSRMNLLLDLVQSRVSACPDAVQPDLAQCVFYLRAMRKPGHRGAKYLVDVDRHASSAIALDSKVLDNREDRALRLMIVAISALRTNTQACDAQAERVLLQIAPVANASTCLKPHG